MVESKLRVGVLGAGAWAKSAHIPGWQRDPRCEVVAICDVKGERAQDFARHFSIPEATDDWQALISRPDIDVIDVVTATHAHFELAWEALQAGKHVLCEKPVAYDFRDTQRAGVGQAQRTKDKARLHFSLQPGHAIC